jgi:hypothetical protein
LASFVSLTATTLYGTGWTGTAPGRGNPTVSGTITSTTDFSDHIKSVDISLDADDIDFTNFGAGGFKEKRTGLLSASVSITFFADYAASQVSTVLVPAILARTSGYWDFKPTSSARSATNPSLVFALTPKSIPVAMAIGAAEEVTVGFSIDGKYARLTS